MDQKQVTATPQLSESDVEALAAQDAELLDEWPEPVIVIAPGQRDALIRDWRALTANLQAHREAMEAFKQVLDKREEENAVLREQLADARAEGERLAAQLKEWQEEKDTKAGYL